MNEIMESGFKNFKRKHPDFFCPFILLDFTSHKLGGKSNIENETCPIMNFEFRCPYYDTPEAKNYKLCPYYQDRG
jgi:hypothetical protein